jgi:cellulose synthase/poly-beta-1,6-N-acetylglucosamine synthase-like glycosyltransferase
MLIIDNRYQNQGRVNLKLSAKNMGDSICIRSTVFSQINLDAGLTEDYTFRQKLLKMGIKIDYNPTAIGRGEAPISWKAAQSQRIRWLRGTYLANRGHSYSLLIEGISRRDKAIVDGAIQGIIPSYSTITLFSIIFCLLSWLTQSWLPSWLPILWTLLIISLLCYPFPALIIERAPLKAYLVILTGPVFIIWRTWLSIKARYFQKDERWIRTPRVEEAETKS